MAIGRFWIVLVFDNDGYTLITSLHVATTVRLKHATVSESGRLNLLGAIVRFTVKNIL
jgi:hypothetical protein